MKTLTGACGEYIYLAKLKGHPGIATLLETPYNPEEMINRIKNNTLSTKFLYIDSQGWRGADFVKNILIRKGYIEGDLVADKLDIILDGVDYECGNRDYWTLCIDTLYCLANVKPSSIT